MLLAALLLAQTAPCVAIDAGLPAPLAGWTAPGAAFAPGKAVTLDTVKPPPLGDPPANLVADRVATLDFTIATAGTYGIALDQRGWIDVSPLGGAALKPVSHRDGDPCWSIRKIVRFDLQPGTYRLDLTRLGLSRAKVMLEQGE